MSVLLDTSTLLLRLTDPSKLSIAAVNAMSEADELLISSMSIWEIGWKVRNDKLIIPDSLQATVATLNDAERVSFVDVTVEIWMENVALDWAHRDLADRTIVATAKLLNVDLITSDREIGKFYERVVW